MSPSNVSELLKVYLDGNSNETQNILEAERQLLQIGYSIVPAIINELRNQLREYRSRTLSYSDEKEFMKGIKEIVGDSSDEFFEEMMSKRAQELERHSNSPGISPVQRLLSSNSIERAYKLVEKLGDTCDQLLCGYLKNPDMSLVMTSVAILCNLQEPSPFIVKSIVSMPYLHLETSIWPAQNRILFYLLLFAIANTGDDYANGFVNSDAREFGTDRENFFHYLMDMCIYFVSVS